MNTKRKVSFSNFAAAFFSLILILTSTNVNSQDDNATKVYKTISADGSISFSDSPSENAKAISVQPVTTVPAYQRLPQIHHNSQALPEIRQPQADYYDSFSIIAPSTQSTFHSGSGTVQVTLGLSPSLRDSDTIRIILDGKTVTEQGSLSYSLAHVSRGEHSLTAQIIGSDNSVLLSANSRFTVHRPTIRN